LTESLAEPLEPEDMCIQSMVEASPTKWHLAHTSWFFETFVLEHFDPAHRPFEPRYRMLFNSYYEAVGPQHARPERGLISRPTVAEVRAYRAYVDQRMQALFESGKPSPELAAVIETGLHHEQQHQELLLTDILHAFSRNPLRPAYRSERPPPAPSASTPLTWTEHPGGVYRIGHEGEGFSFDNEGPRHEALLRPFALASRPVTNAELAEFVTDGGYETPVLWLSAGWATVQARGWRAPLYWEREGDAWLGFTLDGLRELDPSAPACHLSFYEADAYARWRDARLPTEAEWEVVAAGLELAGNFVESGALAPRAADATSTPTRQMFGDVWEWTASPYVGYPGYRAPAGAIGEYNGKFMSDQWVLRGGSCTTSRSHVRPTYRNFFPADARWQFSGIRLARDAS
jgi:ergothioneine biosynthesis protein EgtB